MTTPMMQIRLSQQAADARWGEKAIISSTDQGMTIHLSAGDELQVIQRAAHKIDGQGIRSVALAGMTGIWNVAGLSGKVFVHQKVIARCSGHN